MKRPVKALGVEMRLKSCLSSLCWVCVLCDVFVRLSGVCLSGVYVCVRCGREYCPDNLFIANLKGDLAKCVSMLCSFHNVFF